MKLPRAILWGKSTHLEDLDRLQMVHGNVKLLIKKRLFILSIKFVSQLHFILFSQITASLYIAFSVLVSVLLCVHVHRSHRNCLMNYTNSLIISPSPSSSLSLSFISNFVSLHAKTVKNIYQPAKSIFQQNRLSNKAVHLHMPDQLQLMVIISFVTLLIFGQDEMKPLN